MKITKNQLKKIIKEELKAVMNEESDPLMDMDIFRKFRFKRPDKSASDRIESSINREYAVQPGLMSRATGWYNTENGNILVVLLRDGQQILQVSYRDDRDPEATDDSYHTASFEEIMGALEDAGFRKVNMPVPMSPTAETNAPEPKKKKALGYPHNLGIGYEQ
jgi:hypothetical protein